MNLMKPFLLQAQPLLLHFHHTLCEIHSCSGSVLLMALYHNEKIETLFK